MNQHVYVSQNHHRVEEVREMIRTIDMVSPPSSPTSVSRANANVRASSASAGGIEDDEVVKETKQKIKCAKAASSKYTWTKFVNIRTPDDFASGIFFSSTRNFVKSNQLKWQKEDLNKSVTKLSTKQVMTNDNFIQHIYMCVDLQYIYIDIDIQ